jgi:two-component system sensor histidine kinase UhpB
MTWQADIRAPATLGRLRAAVVSKVVSPVTWVAAAAWRCSDIVMVLARSRTARSWARRSLRGQLLTIVIAIQIAAGLLAGGVTIIKARSSTQIEVQASFRLAAPLVRKSVRLIPQDRPPSLVLDALPLQLRSLRHVRIVVLDAAGHPVGRGGEQGEDDLAHERTPAPAWFHALVTPPVQSLAIPVVVHGETIGSVVVASEPDDEISEVWEESVALGMVALVFNAAILAALYVLFGRALQPVDGFARALTDLERRDYDVRLPMPAAREFATLTARFNALAEALAGARTENLTLSRRLITAEDDERRRTALELHDEVGPCLFGLRVAAASLASLEGHTLAAAAPARARDMLEIIERLQVVNRNLLNRLRPMALGHVPLADLLEQILRDRKREHPHLIFTLQAPRLAAGYGDEVDLTVYRCVQESLTNAIRHGVPRSVNVTLTENEASPAAGGSCGGLALRIEDDGTGFAGATVWGFGLRGMAERVMALGGAFSIGRRAGGGTVVSVMIPLAPVPLSRRQGVT